jgi:hypothetical protein
MSKKYASPSRQGEKLPTMWRLLLRMKNLITLICIELQFLLPSGINLASALHSLRRGSDVSLLRNSLTDGGGSEVLGIQSVRTGKRRRQGKGERYLSGLA